MFCKNFCSFNIKEVKVTWNLKLTVQMLLWKITVKIKKLFSSLNALRIRKQLGGYWLSDFLWYWTTLMYSLQHIVHCTVDHYFLLTNKDKILGKSMSLDLSQFDPIFYSRTFVDIKDRRHQKIVLRTMNTIYNKKQSWE